MTVSDDPTRLNLTHDNDGSFCIRSRRISSSPGISASGRNGTIEAHLSFTSIRSATSGTSDSTLYRPKKKGTYKRYYKYNNISIMN